MEKPTKPFRWPKYYGKKWYFADYDYDTGKGIVGNGDPKAHELKNVTLPPAIRELVRDYYRNGWEDAKQEIRKTLGVKP